MTEKELQEWRLLRKESLTRQLTNEERKRLDVLEIKKELQDGNDAATGKGLK
jgi:hypothetical protein